MYFLMLSIGFIIIFALLIKCIKIRKKNHFNKKAMRKILLLLIACMFISIGIQAQSVTGVSLDHDTITLGVGNDIILHATIQPSGATNKSVVWGTKNSAIASIDTTSITEEANLRCVVTGIDIGETKISVKARDGNFTDTCVIKVIRLVEGIELNKNSMTITIGRDSVLEAFFSPDNATNDSVIWISRDSSIVNIISTEANRFDSICNINAVSLGTVFIVAESVDGGFKDSCEVTVVTAQIESFSLNSDSIELFKDSDTILIAQIRPLEGTVKTITWTTDDIFDRVISISSGHDTIITITANGAGRAIIIAEAYGGKKDTCVITVRGPVKGISLNKDSLELKLNADTIALSATITPLFVINDSILWTSADSTIVDITSPATMTNALTCQIKALRPGTAKIFAVTFDGGFIDSCTVTVIVPVDSVVLDSEYITSLNLKTDSVGVLRARIYPGSATDRSLIWVNLDESLARIDSIRCDTICYFTVFKEGIDTIYAETPDGIKSRFCYIHIPVREVDSVEIIKDETIVNDTILLIVKDSLEIVTTVYPLNASNDTIILESNNPDIVKVDSTSNSVFIKALKEGVTIIYAKPADGLGGQIDSCIVKVRSLPVTDISLSADTIRLYEQNVGELIARLLPENATNDSLVWTTNDNSVIRIEPSTGYDSICTFTGLMADTAYIYATSKEDSSIKDSCVIIVREQFVFLEADTVSLDGIIKLSLLIPEGVSFTGSFELQLPKGFGLTNQGSGFRTVLANDFKDIFDLVITYVNDSTYLFDITPKATPTSSMLRSGTKKALMDIYYTIYDNTLLNSTTIFEAKLIDISFNFSNNDEIKEEQEIVKIKSYRDATGNEIINEPGKSFAYIVNGSLYINSDKAETVYIYSLNGSLLYMKDKTEGPAVFDINIPEKIIVVKGSSGWVNKVLNR